MFVDPSIVADELAVQPGKSAKRRDPGAGAKYVRHDNKVSGRGAAVCHTGGTCLANRTLLRVPVDDICATVHDHAVRDATPAIP